MAKAFFSLSPLFILLCLGALFAQQEADQVASISSNGPVPEFSGGDSFSSVSSGDNEDELSLPPFSVEETAESSTYVEIHVNLVNIPEDLANFLEHNTQFFDPDNSDDFPDFFPVPACGDKAHMHLPPHHHQHPQGMPMMDEDGNMMMNSDMMNGDMMNGDMSGSMMNGDGSMMNGDMNGNVMDGGMMNGDMNGGMMNDDMNGNMMNGDMNGGMMNGDMNGNMMNGDMNGGMMQNGHKHMHQHADQAPHRRHGMYMCIALSLLLLSLVLCCCCGPRSRIPDEEDYIPVRQFTTQSEEQILEMVQRQSLAEYQQQQQSHMASAPEGMGYMRVPVMSPEAYAQYLAAASAPRDV